MGSLFCTLYCCSTHLLFLSPPFDIAAGTRNLAYLVNGTFQTIPRPNDIIYLVNGTGNPQPVVDLVNQSMVCPTLTASRWPLPFPRAFLICGRCFRRLAVASWGARLACSAEVTARYPGSVQER